MQNVDKLTIILETAIRVLMKNLILLIILCSSKISFAALYKFQIRQKGQGTGLKRVEVKSDDLVFYSDPTGFVQIETKNAPKSVSLSRPGFQTLQIAGGELSTTEINEVFLIPALTGSDEVVIMGEKRPSVSKKVISADEARAVAPRGDPGQITKLMPGVQQSGFSSQVSVRGSAPSDSLYYVDGLAVPFVYHTIFQLSIIPAEIFSGVEFYSGGFGVEYGNALGGVIILRTKTEIPERAKTTFTLNLPFFSGIYHERPLSEHESLIVSARKSYIQYILPKIIPKNSGTVIAPYFEDYQIVYTYKKDDGHYKVTALAADDGLTATIPSANSKEDSGNINFESQTYFARFGVERNLKLSSDLTLVSTPQIGYTKISFDTGDLLFKLGYWDVGIPTELTQRISKDEKFYVGIDPQYGAAQVTYNLPKVTSNDPYYDRDEAPYEEGQKNLPYFQASTWVARDFKLSELILTPGLRASYFNPIKKTAIDPRLSARLKLNQIHTLKAAVGQYSKAPENGEPYEDVGNPDLTHERSNHYIFGIESQIAQFYSTDFQVFYKRGYWIIEPDAKDNYNNAGSQKTYGFEAFLRKNPSERWFSWLSYTYSFNRERISDDSEWTPGKYDQTHVLNLAGSYKWSAQFETGGRFQHHSGDRYTSKSGNSVYNTNFDKYQARDNGTGTYGSRLPNYYDLNVYNGHDFLFDTWKINLRYGVESFWFKRPIYGVRNNYDYSKETYVEGLFPIPYVEVRGEI